jgi:Tol biopolymer transport system component
MADRGSSKIYVANADGTGSFTRLGAAADDTVSDWSPTWSPDGRLIAFVRGPGVVNAGDVRSDGLYVMNVDGSEARRVANPAGGAGRPAWKPVP